MAFGRAAVGAAVVLLLLNVIGASRRRSVTAAAHLPAVTTVFAAALSLDLLTAVIPTWHLEVF